MKNLHPKEESKASSWYNVVTLYRSTVKNDEAEAENTLIEIEFFNMNTMFLNKIIGFELLDGRQDMDIITMLIKELPECKFYRNFI